MRSDISLLTNYVTGL